MEHQQPFHARSGDVLIEGDVAVLSFSDSDRWPTECVCFHEDPRVGIAARERLTRCATRAAAANSAGVNGSGPGGSARLR